MKYRDNHLDLPGKTPVLCSNLRTAIATLVALVLLASLPLIAQSGDAASQAPQAQSQQDQVPAAAGGPTGETGPIAVPKKSGNDEPPPPPKPKHEDIPQYSLHKDVPIVTIDAHVLSKDGRPVPLSVDAAKEHFKVWEDGVPQQVQSVTKTQGAITAVLLVEFASTNYNFMYDALNASYVFATGLQPQDWVAVVQFDIRDHVLVDFTQDKQSIMGAISSMQIPTFHETDIFDAMYDTLDRLDRVPGHKELVVVASGRDTFSKHNLDDVLKKIKATPDVTIYTICTGIAFLDWVEGATAQSPYASASVMEWKQAQNQMSYFARMTGGRTYAPRLMGEVPDIFREVAGAIRDQYTITYKPSNTKQDGTYRKLRVELSGPNDQPLVIKDQKDHEIKYKVVAREGYTAKHQVE